MTPSRRRVAIELASRLLLLACFGSFAWRALASLRAEFSVPLLLLLLKDLLNVVLVLIARMPRTVERTPYAVVISVVGSFVLLVVDVEHGAALIPASAAVAIQVLGWCVQIGAKLSLGRSYGLLPANRGVVTGGPYRVVRHPMYLGYVLITFGFVLGSFTATNALVYTGFYLVLVLRILREERLLEADAAYRDYSTRVRYRLLPLIF